MELGIRSKSAASAYSADLFDLLEQERKRIACDLHDGLGQSLTAIKLAVERYMVQRERREVPNDELLSFVIAKAREAIDETRRIAMGLRPAILDDLGLIAAIEWLCRQFRTTHPEVRLVLRIDLDEKVITSELATAIYRVVQEGLNNVTNHASAEKVVLSVRNAAGMVWLRLRDDGRGFSYGACRAVTDGQGRTHQGILGMQARTHATGGNLRIDSRPGEGTLIECLWPIAQRRIQ